MTRPRVTLKALSELRWQVLWYGLGLALMAMLVVYIYPSYHAQLADFEVPEALRAIIGNVDYTTGAGFLSAEFFSWIPIILVIFAITSGTAALAGEEANGTLDLLLAQPIRRKRLLLEKTAALVTATGGIAVICYAGWLVSVPFVDIDVGLGKLALATLNVIPLTIFFQAFAVWAGVTMPRRGTATGLVTAFAVASFFINYLASLVDVLEPLRWVSAFHYYNGDTVLTDGADLGGVLVLLALSALFTGLAAATFERRDIGVNGPLRLFRRRGEASATQG
jgi:ABC-2 type transport system permease protein